MSWQLAITLQVCVGSLMALYSRRLSLTTKHAVFAIGVLSFITIAVCGSALALLHSSEVHAVTGTTWLYILVEGLFIPGNWLIQYRLISQIGAANAAITTTLNTVGAAVMGIIFLHEGLTIRFVAGMLLIVTSTFISLRIQPDTKHASTMAFSTKLRLALAGTVLYGCGMLAEKSAITAIGVWSYTAYGWIAQAIGAILLFCLFGRSELRSVNGRLIAKGVSLGVITCVVGTLYVYALTKGSLSHTIIATSGRLAIVALLAAILLHERNKLSHRVIAFCLAVAGLSLIVG